MLRLRLPALHLKAFRSSISSISSYKVNSEVSDAIAGSKAVVALESTIISHGGLPYPRNLELALDLESVIRQEGGVPGTCAVVDGVPTIGLSMEQLDAIATRKDVMKASRRDLPYACGLGKWASTTVAATMILAHAAGIRFFATGGIGGVHRGAEETFDVSADLLELGKTPVVVVSAGVKSILDIPKTLEVLESQGVPVLSFQSDTFPEFFTHGTIPSPRRVNSEEEVARMVLAASHCFNKPFESGMVCAVPNPAPYDDAAGLERCILQALSQADSEGVKGAAITPYILAAIEKMTGGDSLESNIALVKNNARVATRIAVEHARLVNNGVGPMMMSRRNPPSNEGSRRGYRTSAMEQQHHVLVVGGSAIDSVSKITVPNTILRSSNPAETRTSYGGVGRNIAERMGLLVAGKNRDRDRDRGEDIGRAVITPPRISLVSVVADDAWGRALIQHLQEVGVDTSMVKVVSSATTASEVSTATYTAIHGQDGDLVVSAGDFSILKHFREEDAEELRESGILQTSTVVVIDGNFEPSVFRSLACALDDIKASCGGKGGPLLAFEPTSDHKCTLPIEAGHMLSSVDIMKPNLSELVIMLERADSGDNGDERGSDVNRDLETVKEHMEKGQDVSIETVEKLAIAMYGLMSGGRSGCNDKHVVVSMGAKGAVWARDGASGVLVSHIPLGDYAVPPEAIKDTNGCGDAFVSGLLLSTADRGGELTNEAILEGFGEARNQILK